MKNSDLKKLLSHYDEQVAVPGDFRAKLMQRLAKEGLLETPAVPARASLLERVWSSLNPRLGLAGAALAALAFVLFAPSGKVGKPELRWPAASNSQGAPKPALEVQASGKPSEAQPSQVQANAPRAHRPKQAAQTAQVAQAPQSQPAPAVAPQIAQASPAPEVEWQSLETELRESEAQSALQPGKASGSSAPDVSIGAQRPTEIVIYPTATPLRSPVRARSEIRQNVARLSRGEQVLIYVNLPAPGKVKIEVYDRLGRRVCVLKDDPFPAGLSEIRWGGHLDNGGLAAAGIYQVVIQAPGFEDRHKIALVK